MQSLVKLPYATTEFPGCGGILKQRTEDFAVEELPKYLPSGSGEHLYLWIEKRGISTVEAIARISRNLGLAPRDVGHAGMKDAQAVTRQWLSLHTHSDPPPERLEVLGLRILEVQRHGNKLRPGHLLGNRFQIVIREAVPPARFNDLLVLLRSRGFPNYFGPQRFGRDGANAMEGRALLRTGFTRRMPVQRARFLTNAYQSAMFNTILATRLAALQQPYEMLAGDLAVFEHSASIFPIAQDGLCEAQARAEAGEISPSAPLFGYKIPLAEGVPGDWERQLLKTENLHPTDFKRGGKRYSAKGERRPVRAFPVELQWEATREDGLPCLRLSFTLKAGVYATAFLRELMKNDCLHNALPTPPTP
ncbi:MAG: tRNA pseudouridine(13) synthase TruD [SAR324 cluster bacterium]|nr:tRNA pseudouridine(13) synthase TruD [SAR324 cluster bacterium]